MNKLIVFILAILIFSACKSSKKAIEKEKNRTVTVEAKDSKNKASVNVSRKEKIKESVVADEIVSTALSYRGTRYKYGGITAKGMDCSGLIFTSFKTHDIPIERTSFSMASQGVKINLKQVKKGDLLFFNTNKSKKRINHVGLVVSVDEKGIKFIHSTTSRGVLISSLKEGYWNYAFIEARRVL
ncbi:NlpC/P60 family protein [Flavobacteriaceae bacterium R38]|nr:NlpC/P60 family protein [Flavobacteriaceae bacterium R38]